MANCNDPQKVDSTTSAMMYYFISKLNGVLGKTHLQKLMFLTDLLATKRFGEPISKMKYVRYSHGPYCKDLNAYIDFLTSNNSIEEKQFPFLSKPNEHYYRFYQKLNMNAKDYLVKSLGAERMLLIDEVAQSYGNRSLQQVLDFVYSLEEVKDAKFDSPIDLAKQYHSEEPFVFEDDLPF